MSQAEPQAQADNKPLEVERVKAVSGKVVVPPVDFTTERDELVKKINAFKTRVKDYQDTLKKSASEFETELEPKLTALTAVQPVPSNDAKVAQLLAASEKLSDLGLRSSVLMQGRFFGQYIPEKPIKHPHYDALVKLTEDFKVAAGVFATATNTKAIDIATRSAREDTTKPVQTLVGMKGDDVEGKPGIGTLAAMTNHLNKEATSLQAKELDALRAQARKYAADLSKFEKDFKEKTGKTIQQAKADLSTTVTEDTNSALNALQSATNERLLKLTRGIQLVVDAGLNQREQSSLQRALDKSFPMDLQAVLDGKGTKKDADELTKFVAMMRAREEDIKHPEKKLRDLYNAEKSKLENENGADKKAKNDNAAANAKRLAEAAGKELNHYLEAVSGKQSVKGHKFQTYKDGTVNQGDADRAFTNLALDIKGAEAAGDSLKKSLLERLGFGKDKEETAPKPAKASKDAQKEQAQAAKVESRKVEGVGFVKTNAAGVQAVSEFAASLKDSQFEAASPKIAPTKNGSHVTVTYTDADNNSNYQSFTVAELSDANNKRVAELRAALAGVKTAREQQESDRVAELKVEPRTVEGVGVVTADLAGARAVFNFATALKDSGLEAASPKIEPTQDSTGVVVSYKDAANVPHTENFTVAELSSSNNRRVTDLLEALSKVKTDKEGLVAESDRSAQRAVQNKFDSLTSAQSAFNQDEQLMRLGIQVTKDRDTGRYFVSFKNKPLTGLSEADSKILAGVTRPDTITKDTSVAGVDDLTKLLTDGDRSFKNRLIGIVQPRIEHEAAQLRSQVLQANESSFTGLANELNDNKYSKATPKVTWSEDRTTVQVSYLDDKKDRKKEEILASELRDPNNKKAQELKGRIEASAKAIAGLDAAAEAKKAREEADLRIEPREVKDVGLVRTTAAGVETFLIFAAVLKESKFEAASPKIAPSKDGNGVTVTYTDAADKLQTQDFTLADLKEENSRKVAELRTALAGVKTEKERLKAENASLVALNIPNFTPKIGDKPEHKLLVEALAPYLAGKDKRSLVSENQITLVLTDQDQAIKRLNVDDAKLHSPGAAAYVAELVNAIPK